MKVLHYIYCFLLLAFLPICSSGEITECVKRIHTPYKGYFVPAFRLGQADVSESALQHNSEAAQLTAFQEELLEEYIKKNAPLAIKQLNLLIKQNTKVLKQNGVGESDYIVDLRRFYSGDVNAFISTAVETKLNAELRSQHIETGKAIYIVLSPIIPDQLSYGAQTDPKLKYSAKNSSIYNSTLTDSQRTTFLQRYSKYVATQSDLSNRGNSGALLSVETLMTYNVNQKKWLCTFLDFIAFSKNINPTVAQSLSQGIQTYKRQVGGIVFSNISSVMEESLSQYVTILVWEFRKAFVTQDSGVQLNTAIGKYRTVLSNLSDSDKTAIFAKLAITNNPTSYSPSKKSGALIDYANVEAYLEKIFWRFNLMNADSRKQISFKVYTTSTINTKSGVQAFQLISEDNLSSKTIGFGYHFVKEGNDVVIYWNSKVSADLNGLILPAEFDKMCRDVGTASYAEATGYYTAQVALDAYYASKNFVTDAWQWGNEKYLMFYDFALTVIEEGRIPESVYGNSITGAFVVGVANAVIDEIKGIYDIVKFLVDAVQLPTKLLLEAVKFVYQYSTDSTFRASINASVNKIINNISLIMAGVVLDIADIFGFPEKIPVMAGIDPGVNPGGFRTAIFQKLSTISASEIDSKLSSALSTPFIAFGTKAESCFTGSTGAQKTYCTAYSATFVLLLCLGEKIFRYVGTAATKIAGSALSGLSLMAKTVSKSKIQGFIDNLARYSDEILARLKLRKVNDVSKWVTDFYKEAKAVTSKNKIIAKGIDKMYPQLLQDEVVAIYHYTTGAYRDFNAALRAADGNIAALSEFNRAFYELLQSGMKKMPQKYSGQLYRGTSLSEAALLKYKNAYTNKVPIVDPAYISTSTGTEVIQRFQMLAKKTGETDVIIYFNAKGKGAVDIDEISRYGRNFIQAGETLQDEVLFMAGSKFNVVGYKESVSTLGQKYIEIILNEIP